MIRHHLSSAGGIACLLAAALAVGGPCRAAEEFHWLIAPDPEADGAPQLHGTTWVHAGPDHIIRLQRIDDANRLAYIEHTTGLPTDPFATPANRQEHYLSFLLEIENRGQTPIETNSFHCWLQTGKKKIQTPLGFTDLSFAYRLAGRELPPAYDRVRSVVLDGPRSIAPDEAIHGLLVYRAIDDNSKRFHVDVQLTMSNGEVVRLSAPYRRTKIKGTERKDDD